METVLCFFKSQFQTNVRDQGYCKHYLLGETRKNGKNPNLPTTQNLDKKIVNPTNDKPLDQVSDRSQKLWSTEL